MRVAIAALGMLLSAPSLAAQSANQRVSSGNEDIDRMRAVVLQSPTAEANSRERLAMLYSWFKLLMHQGMDMRSFEPVRSRMGQGQPASAELPRQIDEGFAVLEKIQNEGNPRENIPGEPTPQPKRVPTDWPLFQANSAETGYTADPGPRQGKVAWRFPIGHNWYARPSVESGRVYIASPGVTTLLYCLDEKTGKVIWKTRQYYLGHYGSSRASSQLVLLKDRVILKETGGANFGAQGAPRHLLYVDKRCGEIIEREPADPVSFRRPMPLTGDDRRLVYLSANLAVRGAGSVASTEDSISMADTVIAQDTQTGKRLWSLRIGDIFGEPVLDGDRIYVGTDAATMLCLNMTGANRVAWRFDAGASMRGTPAVAGDSVYVAAENGFIYSLNKQTGKRKWSYQVKEGEPRALQMFSTPTIADGILYVGAANRYLYALNAETGGLVWRYRLSDWVRARPVAQDGAVYVATLDGTVSCLRSGASGPRLVWSRKAGSYQILADLVLDQDNLLVNSSELFLYSLDVRDGSLRWRQSLLECAYIGGERVLADMVGGGADYQSSPTAAQGKVFIGGPNRFVYAVDTETGKEAWRFETSGQISATPIYFAGRVYIGQEGGNADFYALNAKDGKLIWKRQIGRAWAGANIKDGELYVPTVEGDIVCLRAVDGEVLWRFRTSSGIFPVPAVDAKRVYVGSWDRYYYALDRETGHLDWTFSWGGKPDSGAPTLWNGRLFVHGLGSDLFAALDAESGQVQWEFHVPADRRINATPAAHGNRVYTSYYLDVAGAPSGGRLLSLDDATGKVVWEHPGGGGLTAPVIGGDRIYYASSTDAFFYSLDAKGDGDGTTKLYWRYKLGGIVEESCPAIYGNKAFVLGSDRYLYAFE